MKKVFYSVLMCVAACSLQAGAADNVSDYTYTVKTYVGRVRGNAANGGTCEGKEYEARFQQPDGLAFAPNGDLWFTDRGSHEIRRVTSDKYVHKVALTGAAIKSPWGAAFAPDGSFVVANKDLKNAVKISQDGVVTEFITGLNNPVGLIYDKAGNLYICDRENNAVKKYDSAGNLLQSYTVTKPNAAAVDTKGRIFVSSNSAYKLFMIDTDGTVTTVFGDGVKPTATTYNNGAPGDLSAANIGIPFGLVFDEDGVLYISDTVLHVIRSLTPDENGDYAKGTLRTVAGTPGKTVADPLQGDGEGSVAKFNYPAEMVISGNTIYLSDELTWSIRTITINKNTSTNVADIETEEAPIEYYNLQGMRVNADALTPGIYVRHQGSKATKVYVK